LKILALDPSSTACGWAVLTPDGRNPAVHDLGVIRPGPGKLWPRIDRLVLKVEELAARVAPSDVVIEVTSGRTYKSNRRQSLAWLAFAQGATVAACRRSCRSIHTVTEQDWTGRKPKRDRAKLVCLWCPTYHKFAPRDPGMDAADAIGVGAWWLDRQLMRDLMCSR
jgi:hypothetical protein